MKAGLTPSKGEGRRLVTQGGVSIDDQEGDGYCGGSNRVRLSIEKGYLVIKKGKKVHHKVVLK